MEGSLKQYVFEKYPDTKYDLFATFIIRCLELCNEQGFTGYMTPFVWMFIASYQKLRESIIDNHFINNLIQLEYSGFDGATVPICTFTFRNKIIQNGKGSYIRLSDFKGSENQEPRTLDAIRNRDCGWFYTANQNDFEKIPNANIGYWLSHNIIELFNKSTVANFCEAKAGIVSGNDADMIKLWHEISINRASFNENSYERRNDLIWVPINKGGEFRKFYGNCEHVINIWNLWTEGRTTVSVRRGAKEFYFKEGVTWTYVTSSISSFRISKNKVFATAAPAIFFEENKYLTYILGFLNTKITKIIIPALNPTLNLVSGDILNIPINYNSIYYELIKRIVLNLIDIEMIEWNSRETSWDFKQNELIKLQVESIKTAFESYKKEWSDKFYELHRNEEELNRQFIEIYGLQDELTPDVPLEEITILQEEGKIVDGQLEIQTTPVMLQLISYAVGCMFGRYSLDKPGLILANQGDTVQNYLEKVQAPTFTPDEDNIIPLLEGEWFSDDIVGRFKEFIKVAFSAEQLNENIGFIEDNIPAKDIRRYFVKDFYNDHIKRYKKRPIYWMFSSPKGHFKALIYMHRYQPDTCSVLLNDYLQPFISKLESAKQTQTMLSLREDLSPRDKVAASKEIDNLQKMIDDCKTYERTLFTLATQKISIDLDDGVKVNYQKFKDVLVPIKGLEKEEE
jgi:type II restriction/modification system DNA methylase subunit YeeA